MHLQAIVQALEPPLPSISLPKPQVPLRSFPTVSWRLESSSRCRFSPSKPTKDPKEASPLDCEQPKPPHDAAHAHPSSSSALVCGPLPSPNHRRPQAPRQTLISPENLKSLLQKPLSSSKEILKKARN
ncbi:hypothetical protein U9M48_009008 [Paspalum notatum var. saurae]|uniref:Uncharacterized protein n=1 Tax=Paspalum notatum var. saurae TaxID=547442 RepID=A0AAQ3SQG3_PASNO